MTMLIVYVLCVVNVITFSVYGWDKLCARKGRWRVPETVLLGLAFMGGALGALLGMKYFHHKTRHRKFNILVPLFLNLQILLAVWLLIR